MLAEAPQSKGYKYVRTELENQFFYEEDSTPQTYCLFAGRIWHTLKQERPRVSRFIVVLEGADKNELNEKLVALVERPDVLLLEGEEQAGAGLPLGPPSPEMRAMLKRIRPQKGRGRPRRE